MKGSPLNKNKNRKKNNHKNQVIVSSFNKSFSLSNKTKKLRGKLFKRNQNNHLTKVKIFLNNLTSNRAKISHKMFQILLK